MPTIILASGSAIRATLLRNAGVPFETAVARIDEESVRHALQAEGASPRDQADALAELKAARVAARRPDALVIGCDQILDFKGTVLPKPADDDAVRAQLTMLRGQTHKLLSAVVLYQDGRPVWRHVGEARLTMRDFTADYLDSYIARNAGSVLDSVGGYKLEAEGVRLFSRIEGDYFTILGLPLLALLGYLGQTGAIPA
jgi:septum formation protein